MVGHQGLVEHVQVGDGSCYGEFAVPDNQASSTWWTSKAGGIEQYVDADMAAWTEAAGNFTWDSVENEGFPTEPLTDAQILSNARIYVQGVQWYNWPLKLAETPADTGLGWHGMGGNAWGGHFGCPGDIRKAQRPAILYIASLALQQPENKVQEASMVGVRRQGGFAAARPDGAVDCFDNAPNFGSMAGRPLSAPIVGLAWTPSGKGYTLVAADGSVYNFGDSVYQGPAPRFRQQWQIGANYNAKIVGIAPGDSSNVAYTLVTDAGPSDTQDRTYGITSDGQYAK